MEKSPSLLPSLPASHTTAAQSLRQSSWTLHHCLSQHTPSHLHHYRLTLFASLSPTPSLSGPDAKQDTWSMATSRPHVLPTNAEMQLTSHQTSPVVLSSIPSQIPSKSMASYLLLLPDHLKPRPQPLASALHLLDPVLPDSLSSSRGAFPTSIP